MEEEEYKELQKDKVAIKEGLEWLKNTEVTPNALVLKFLNSICEEKLAIRQIGERLLGGCSFDVPKLLKIQEVENCPFASYSERALEEILVEAKYFNYIQKQQNMIENMDKMLSIEIPQDFVFDKIPGLSLEVIEKLKKFNPKSLFEASEISGVTPASLEVLQLYIHLYHKNNFSFSEIALKSQNFNFRL